MIINLGLPRTGTQSLNRALQRMGYDSVHYAANIQAIEGHDAACELSTYIDLEQLAESYPDAVYLCTVRDFDDWFGSVERMKAKAGNAKRWNPFWKTPLSDMREFYNQHDELIAEVVSKYNLNAWQIPICHYSSSDNWDILCDALGCDVPDFEFPHTNRSRK